MHSLREKHTGLNTENGGRWASVRHQEGGTLSSHQIDTTPLQLRYDLDGKITTAIDQMREAGATVQEIAEKHQLIEPVVADILDGLTREQITADEGVPAEMMRALRSAGIGSSHVERMKRGKMNIRTEGLKIRVDLDAHGNPMYELKGETIRSEGSDDHDAWVTALVETVDREAIKRNVSPLVAQGDVSLKLNNHTGTAKGSWKLDAHEVKFEITAGGHVTFDSQMNVEDGHALQKDLGVKSIEQVGPLISRLRGGLSAAHRWALWHPSMDVHRHEARPGLQDTFQYERLRTSMLDALAPAKASYLETQQGVILSTSGPGYDAEVLVSAIGEPTYYINQQEVYGLDESKTNQRELAKFLRSNIDSLRTLETGRRSGLALRRKHV